MVFMTSKTLLNVKTVIISLVEAFLFSSQFKSKLYTEMKFTFFSRISGLFKGFIIIFRDILRQTYDRESVGPCKFLSIYSKKNELKKCVNVIVKFFFRRKF